MFINENAVVELEYYLKSLQVLVQELPLDHVVHAEGTSVGQVAFHAAESVNYYLRVFLLEREYSRKREEEFSKKYDQGEILRSIEKALLACKEVVKEKIPLEKRLAKTKMVHSIGFELTTAFEALQHTTAHTADHFG